MSDTANVEGYTNRRRDWLSLAGLLVIIGLFLYVADTQIKRQGFWHDEVYTLSFMRGFDTYLFPGSDLQENSVHSVQWYRQHLQQDTYWQHFWRNIVHEGHPPIYFLLLKLWSYLAGSSEAGLRSFSVLASAISLTVAFKAGALFSRRFALLFAGLLACCPLFLHFALEARMYALYLLLALICFYLFLKLLRHEAPVPHPLLIGFIAAGVALLFTHYYGIFFYGILALVIGVRLLRQRAWKSIAGLSLPAIALLPWLPIIQLQTVAQKNHWTNGSLGFGVSFQQFVKGSTELLTMPFQDQTAYEFYCVYALLLLLLLNLPLKDSYLRNRLLASGVLFALYGLCIFIFDKVLNHHTIAVPRYYLPLQFVGLFAVAFMVEKGRSRALAWLAYAALVVLFGKIQVDVFTTTRQAKQMYREVGGYLANRYDPLTTEVVVSPNGPSAVGVAYYSPKNFTIRTMPAPLVCAEYNKPRVVVVEQHLGLSSEPWALSCKSPAAESRVIRFVGVDVVNEK
jgi:uncharacterized membrane protein